MFSKKTISFQTAGSIPWFGCVFRMHHRVSHMFPARFDVNMLPMLKGKKVDTFVCFFWCVRHNQLFCARSSVNMFAFKTWAPLTMQNKVWAFALFFASRSFETHFVTVLSRHGDAKMVLQIHDFFVNVLRWKCQFAFRVAANHFANVKHARPGWNFGFSRPIFWEVAVAFVLGTMENSVPSATMAQCRFKNASAWFVYHHAWVSGEVGLTTAKFSL